jgi:hypothetical protein
MARCTFPLLGWSGILWLGGGKGRVTRPCPRCGAFIDRASERVHGKEVQASGIRIGSPADGSNRRALIRYCLPLYQLALRDVSSSTPAGVDKRSWCLTLAANDAVEARTPLARCRSDGAERFRPRAVLRDAYASRGRSMAPCPHPHAILCCRNPVVPSCGCALV